MVGPAWLPEEWEMISPFLALWTLNIWTAPPPTPTQPTAKPINHPKQQSISKQTRVAHSAGNCLTFNEKHHSLEYFFIPFFWAEDPGARIHKTVIIRPFECPSRPIADHQWPILDHLEVCYGYSPRPLVASPDSLCTTLYVYLYYTLCKYSVDPRWGPPTLVAHRTPITGGCCHRRPNGNKMVYWGPPPPPQGENQPALTSCYSLPSPLPS